MEKVKVLYHRLQNSLLVQNKPLNGLLKVVIFGVFLFSLYKRIEDKDNLPALLSAVADSWQFPNVLWFAVACITMPLIPLTETALWHQLLRKIVPDLSVRTALKAVLAGCTFSLFTPNGIGNVAGPIVLLPTTRKSSIVTSLLVSGTARQVISNTMGVVSMVYIFHRFPVVSVNWFKYYLLAIAALYTIIHIFYYFNIRVLVWLTQRFGWLNRFTKYLRVLNDFDQPLLRQQVLWTGVRYGIMVSQYYLFVRFFGIEVPYIEGVFIISLMFFFKSFVPLPPSLALVVRAELALYFWSFYTDNQVNILAATFTVWLVNIVLPALVGLAFIGSANIATNLFGQRPKT